MLNKKSLVPISFSVTILLSSLDFYLLKLFPKAMFVVHNILSMFVGFFILYYSTKLLDRNIDEKSVFYGAFIIGMAMIIIHITKIAIGKCI
ncbi:hypothetical protein GOV08_05030 [Candidatus Woesearchaeota archaeon]|nr:hypothetical protein [Candidatus Woesearchaeota archaeon]